jgi:hypothetical protein
LELTGVQQKKRREVKKCFPTRGKSTPVRRGTVRKANSSPVLSTEHDLVHAGNEPVPTVDGKRINGVFVLQQKTCAVAYGPLHESRRPRRYKEHGDTNINIMNTSSANEIKLLDRDYSNNINNK